MKNNYLFALLTSVAVFGMASCQDDPLLPSSAGQSSTVEGQTIEDGIISFDVEIPPMESEQGEDWENYIDPSKFRVLFFTGDLKDENGELKYPDPTDYQYMKTGVKDENNHGNKYLFEVPRSHISIIRHNDALTTSDGQNARGYRITISEKDLFNHDACVDVNSNDWEAAQVNQAIRNTVMGYKKTVDDAGNPLEQPEYSGNGFKIVVLANFPNFVEGQRYYDNSSEDPIVGNFSVPTSDLHFKFGDDLSELSQCVYDNVYGDYRPSDVTNISRNHAYKHFPYYNPNDPNENFTLGGRMGVYSVWVKNYFEKFSDVSDFLRNPPAGNGAVLKDENGFEYGFDYGYAPDPNNTGKHIFVPYTYFRSFDDNPSTKDLNSYRLENVWRVWNFSAGQNTQEPYVKWAEYINSGKDPEEDDVKPEGSHGYHTLTSDVAEYWQLRNSENVVEPFRNLTGSVDLDGLVVNLDDQSYQPETFGECLRLGQTVNNGVKYPTEDDNKKAIKLRIFGEGTLRIKATAPGNNGKLMVTGRTAKRSGSGASTNACEPLYHVYGDGTASGGISGALSDAVSVYPGSTLLDLVPHINDNGEFVDGLSYFKDDGGYGWSYIVEPNSYPYIDVYIHAHGGTILIHEIEFVRDRHLYDTGRVGIMPGSQNPIPMYGCQEFDVIGKYVDKMRALTPDAFFNCSDPSLNKPDPDPYDPVLQGREYKYKRVYLLRSLAKVELLIKKSTFRNNLPSHIYMRTFNRSARCEPKDVITPTEVLWYGSDYMDLYSTDKTHQGYYTKRYPNIGSGGVNDNRFKGIRAEFDNIRSFGALRITKDPSKPNDSYDDKEEDLYLPAYYSKTSWFFGMWQEWRSRRSPDGWKWNQADIAYTVDPSEFNENGLPYPRVFNSRVDRSDYCRLRYVGEENGYLKYVIYVPEKNIDDADSKGNLSKTSKVAHIELRFNGMNEATNMDDEHIYRLYFADYSDQRMKDTTRDRWDNMEKYNEDNFLGELCYPIIRNHIYRFRVNSVNGGQLGVDFQICGAANRQYPGSVVFK